MFFVNLSCYFKIAEQNKCWKIISNNSCFLSHQSIHEHYQIVPLWSLYKHKKFTTNQRGMIDVCTPVLWVLFLRMTVNILLFLSSMDLNYHTRKSQHSFFFFFRCWIYSRILCLHKKYEENQRENLRDTKYFIHSN